MDWVLSLTEEAQKSQSQGATTAKGITVQKDRINTQQSRQIAKFASWASVIAHGPLEAPTGPGHLIPVP